ncbi:MAG TPA: type 4a pilus biogenesis protein PilO [bacterium]|nr:type 4a pilus biogenesis protein PilO [bacterium]
MNLREPHILKGVAGVAILIVLVWLIFFTNYLPFSPKRTSVVLSKLHGELDAAGGELQRAKTIAESIPKLEGELTRMQAKWEALKNLLPKATEMSNLLAEITTSGLKAGVQFTLFEPQGAEPADIYTRYPIKVTVTGGYHQVGQFFDNLCNMDRLVGVSDVKLTQNEKGLTASTVEATAIVSAYTYNEGAEKAAKPGQTSKPTTQPEAGKQPAGK